MTIERNLSANAANNDPHDFTIIGRLSWRGQGLELPNRPAGAKTLHDFPNERAFEAHLEVRELKALALETDREGSDFAMARCDGPHGSHRWTKLHAFPTRPWLHLNESPAAPFPGRQCQFFDNRLCGVRKHKIASTLSEVDSTNANADGIDSFQFCRRSGSHHIRQAGRAAHSDHRRYPCFRKTPPEPQLAARPDKQSSEIKICDSRLERGSHHIEIELVTSAVDDNRISAKNCGKAGWIPGVGACV